MLNRLRKIVVMLSAGAIIAGCETKAGTGAIIGGLGGAAAGGLIGSYSHARAGEGAAIGAAAGAIGGALVGHAMDKEDEKKAKEREEERYSSNRDSAYYYDHGGASKITKRDVIVWTDKGVRDSVIIDRIDRSGQVFRLNAADENELRDAGVSEPVIRALKDTARR